MTLRSAGFMAMAALATAGLAVAQESDVAEGAKLYTAHCRMCHGENVQGAVSMPPLRIAAAAALPHAASDAPMQLAFAPPFGPNLRGVVGRPAGTAKDFVYSEPFLKALTGMTWDEGTLDWWIRDTQAWVPGTVMFYRQKDPEIRRKIIAYLKANH